MLKKVEGLLMIGGASRNVGKTTLTCRIINHFSKSQKIVGLKIKTIYKDDQFFHGKDRNHLIENYRLVEEFDRISNEDTSAMLNAGAKRVFRLKVYNEFLAEAFQFFIEKINENSLIVCESNSLRKVVLPDVFMMIKHENEQNMKPSAMELEDLANKIIYTDGEKHLFDMHELEIVLNKWTLKNINK